MLLLIVLYACFGTVAVFCFTQKSDKLIYTDGTQGNPLVWNLRSISGIVLLAVFPVLFTDTQLPYLAPGNYSFNLLLSIFLVSGILLNISVLSGIKLPTPHFAKTTSSTSIKIGIVLRAAFLFAYEFYFRGLLFFGLAAITGCYLAALVSTGLYALVHYGSNRIEALATLPFGFFLCWISFATHSIWPAVVLHWTIALPNEIISAFKLLKTQKKQPL